MGFKPYITSIVLVVAFTLAMTLFATNFLGENNPNSTVLNSTEFGGVVKSINKSVLEFNKVAETQKNTLENSNPATQFFYLIFEGAFRIPIAFIGIATGGITSITEGVFPSLFGARNDGGNINQFWVIVNVINGLLIFALIVLVIKFIRSGEGER